ncbi:unnamed protein product, partial [marine sediment metagenome]
KVSVALRALIMLYERERMYEEWVWACEKLLKKNPNHVYAGRSLKIVIFLMKYPYDRPTIECSQVIKPVKIDGDLSEWGKAKKIVVNVDDRIVKLFGQIPPRRGKKEYIDAGSNVYSMWDNENIYFAEERKDKEIVCDVVGQEMYFSDAILIFLDLANIEGGHAWTDGEYGFFFCPTGPDNRPHKWVREGHNEGKKEYEPEGVKVASKITGDGYVMEMAIPWKSMQVTRFVAKEGMEGRFTAVIVDKDKEYRGQINWCDMKTSGDDDSGWGGLIFR